MVQLILIWFGSVNRVGSVFGYFCPPLGTVFQISPLYRVPRAFLFIFLFVLKNIHKKENRRTPLSNALTQFRPLLFTLGSLA